MQRNDLTSGLQAEKFEVLNTYTTYRLHQKIKTHEKYCEIIVKQAKASKQIYLEIKVKNKVAVFESIY